MIYVANYDDNRVSVIDGKTNTVTAHINTAYSPITANRLNNMVYVAESGGVSVIDPPMSLLRHQHLSSFDNIEIGQSRGMK